MHCPRSSRYMYGLERGRKALAFCKQWLFNCVQLCLHSSRSRNLLILFLVGTMFLWLLLMVIAHPVGLLSSSSLQLFDGKVHQSAKVEEGNIERYTIANVSDPNDSVTSDDLLEWTKKDKRRMLHAVYRVGNLDRTIKFYTECLGMKVLRMRDIPEERYSNAFLGYGSEDSHFSLELTYNYGVDSYNIGTGFGHFGIAVENVAKTIDLVKSKGGKVTQEPHPSKGRNVRLAFIKDPDGYEFKLLEKAPTFEPLNQVMLRVGDIDRSINFYRKAVGMNLLHKKDYPDDKYTVATMGYDPQGKSTVLQLTYNYGVKGYDKGDGYAQIAIGTDDVYKSAEAIKLCGGQVIREPGPLPGINTKITVFLDPDGWKIAFVDNIDLLKELK